MSDDLPGDWGRRLFLFLTALLLFLGLTFLAVKLFRQMNAPVPASSTQH